MGVMTDGSMVAVAARRLMADVMCVRPGENVLVTADAATDPLAVQALFNAARVQGGRVSVCTTPQLPFQGSLADPYVSDMLAAAVKNCDVWFDLTFPYMGGSAAHRASMEAGRTRCLLLADLGADGIARLYGMVDLDRLYEAQEVFDRLVTDNVGKECRVTCPHGTDFRFVIDKPATRKMRHTTEPGTYTPPGSAVIYPVLESVQGAAVVWAVFHEFHTRLAEPFRIVFDGGNRNAGGGAITEVTGGGNELTAMKRALKRAGGGSEYGSLIHLSHGFHPTARLTGRSFIEDIRVRGNNAIGLGIPWWLPGGGENHPDAVTVMQSMWIDGRQVVRDGVVVGPPDLAKLENALEPFHV